MMKKIIPYESFKINEGEKMPESNDYVTVTDYYKKNSHNEKFVELVDTLTDLAKSNNIKFKLDYSFEWKQIEITVDPALPPNIYKGIIKGLRAEKWIVGDEPEKPRNRAEEKEMAYKSVFRIS